jgi:anthranilate synthase component 2
MIAVIDNYDSFTYNLVQILQKNKFEVEVFKNDGVTMDELNQNADRIKAFLLSPGPGRPEESGVCRSLIQRFHAEKPIFGVCLGHQILAEFFGAEVVPADQIMHGKISKIYHHETEIYKNVPNPFAATRYHSLIVKKESLPADLELTSWTQNSEGRPNEIMGFRHKRFKIEGVQFHPESVMSPDAEALVLNFFS